MELIISIVALSLSAFTFYWLNIREKKNFYLLRLDRMGGFQTPEFALVNGGSKHILVTTIKCGFEKLDEESAFYPAQIIECGKEGSLLIDAGKAIHCKVHFPEPFSESFVKSGKLREGDNPPMYMHKFIINISWVDSRGGNYHAKAHVNDYGFRENGKLSMFSPVQKKYDLQTALTRKSSGWK